MGHSLDMIKRFIFLTSACLLFTFCNNSNHEPKYSLHNSYNDFLNFLQNAIDTIPSGIDKTIYIRIKTAELIDGGVGGNDVSLIDNNWPSWTGDRFYNIFFCDSGTVKCGGSSHFLKHVYTDLGFKAETYNIGLDDPLTHQMSLVYIDSENDYIIQDAFFNATFYNRENNQVLLFRELICLLENRKYELINIVQAEYEHIPYWDWSGIDSHFNDDNKKKEFINSGKNFRDFDFFVENINPLIKAFDPNLSFIDLYLKPLEDNSDEIKSIVLNEICE